MKFDWKFSVAIVLAVVAVSLSIFALKGEKQKIGYVRSLELVNKYAGMVEARNEYQKKSEAWTANVDTLKSDFEASIAKYRAEADKMTESQRKEEEMKLQKKQQNFLQYSKVIEEKAKEEDGKMTDAVLNQINSFVEEYGKENGYDIILGTTASGNILYGKPGWDVTEEVLKALNESYSGKK